MDLVAIAVHFASWCGRAPLCRCGRGSSSLIGAASRGQARQPLRDRRTDRVKPPSDPVAPQSENPDRSKRCKNGRT
ncbi:hypothetical protein BN2537_5143 [Streptomyces venezuelae]|nr:hypothetical protein BN2537_5143 [Streptomyces venezuelae]